MVSEEATVDKGLYVLSERSFAGHVSKKDTFVKFYAPWCGHCQVLLLCFLFPSRDACPNLMNISMQKLAPVWDELAADFEKDGGVTIAKLDCTTASALCQEHGVRGYPTLSFFRNGKKAEDYKGARYGYIKPLG